MIGFIRAITAILIAILIQGGISGAVETTPEEEVADFMAGLMTNDSQVIERYMDNEYINFLANIDTDEETKARMNEALFKNLKYEIEDTAQKGGAAVVEVRLYTNDFSDVLQKYKDASYEYVMNNLYDDKVTNKKLLSKKCLEIYVDQIEKDAKKETSLEKKIYIPMIEDGYGGWKLLLNKGIMKNIMGKLAIPK